MPLKNPFKLEKLKISVFGNRRRIGLPQDTFEVMFNPTSFSMTHENMFQKLQGIQTSGRRAMYSHSRSEELSLTLILDGTGVSDIGVLGLGPLGTPSVSDQVDKFLTTCFHMDGEIHEPKFLRIHWGTGVLKSFDCRLRRADVKYIAFDKSGAPLGAELSTVFVEDLDQAKRIRQEGKSSPDLTHHRVVRAGDTLTGLCHSIYGSARYCVQVAGVNGLDSLRELEPGRELVFPPLEN